MTNPPEKENDSVEDEKIDPMWEYRASAAQWTPDDTYHGGLGYICDTDGVELKNW
jgi:hypothetical protein